VSERQAVEEAVRTYLDEIIRPPRSGEVDLRRLEVVQIAADNAVAELQASVTRAFDHPVHGLIVTTEAFSGPVELERERGSWQVVDLSVDGRRQSESLREVTGHAVLDDLRLDDLKLDLGARGTTLDFVVENRGARPVVVFETLRGARTLGLWSYLWVPLDPVEVEAGDRRPARASWREAFPLDTTELRFVVRAGEVDGSRRFELHFAVRLAPVAAVAPLGRPPWRARLSVRGRRWLGLAPLGVFGILLLLHRFRAAGIVFALEGLAVGVSGGYLWFGRRRWRPDLRFVVATLAVIAVGVWLAWIGGSG
jgi:hypothetical protein